MGSSEFLFTTAKLLKTLNLAFNLITLTMPNSEKRQSEDLETNSFKESKVQSVSTNDSSESTTKSLGVRKAELLADQYPTLMLKLAFFFTIFLVAYAYYIESIIRNKLTAYAASSMQNHALQSTVGIVLDVVSVVSQPLTARLSDRFGRIELIIVAILFHTVGTIIQCQSTTLEAFAAGAAIYQAGYRGFVLLVRIIIADHTTLNWRLAATMIPILPVIINTWVSGDVMASIYPAHSWNYGIGIWAFIFPLACIPMLGCLVHMWFKARKSSEWIQLKETSKSEVKFASWNDNIVKNIFWEMDVLGFILLMAMSGLILVPFTLAGGVADQWDQAKVIAPLVIGVVLLPIFIFHEVKVAKVPMFPSVLMKDKGIVAGLFIGIFAFLIWPLAFEYLYSILVIGLNSSVKAATRITSLYSFTMVITGQIFGLLVVKLRRLKPFIIFGICCWVGSMAILYNFRGAAPTEAEGAIRGIIGGVCFMGFGMAFINMPTQVLLTASTSHEYMAIVISLYSSFHSIGSAIGSSISGGLWTNKLYDSIVEEFDAIDVSEKLAAKAYKDPFAFIKKYTWRTPERDAIVESYSQIQRLLSIVGLSLTFVLLISSLFLNNPRLESVQSIDEYEGEGEGSREGNGEKDGKKEKDVYERAVDGFKSVIGRK